MGQLNIDKSIRTIHIRRSQIRLWMFHLSAIWEIILIRLKLKLSNLVWILKNAKNRETIWRNSSTVMTNSNIMRILRILDITRIIIIPFLSLITTIVWIMKSTLTLLKTLAYFLQLMHAFPTSRTSIMSKRKHIVQVVVGFWRTMKMNGILQSILMKHVNVQGLTSQESLVVETIVWVWFGFSFF